MLQASAALCDPCVENGKLAELTFGAHSPTSRKDLTLLTSRAPFVFPGWEALGTLWGKWKDVDYVSNLVSGCMLIVRQKGVAEVIYF